MTHTTRGTSPTCPLDTPGCPYLSYLLEGLGVKVGEDVAVGLGEDLEGDGAVVVLQRGDIVVADGQFGSGVDLIPETTDTAVSTLAR